MDFSDPALYQGGGLSVLVLAVLRAYAAPFFSAASEMAKFLKNANASLERHDQHLKAEESHQGRVETLLAQVRDRLPSMKVVGSDSGS